MGGSGSTRWGWRPRLPLVTDAPLSLALQGTRALQGSRYALDSPTLTDTMLRWERDGAPVASMRCAFGPRESWGKRVTLTYVAGYGDAPPVPVTDHLRAEALPQRFGGYRWWWACPGCQTLRAVLYLPPGPALRFRCRVCHRLRYPTQRLDRNARAAWRVSLCARRAGGVAPLPEDGASWPPPRPKGMHHATYRRHVEAWARAHYWRELLDKVRMIRSMARLPWLFHGNATARDEVRDLARTDFSWDVATSPDADAFVREVLSDLGYDD